MRTRVRRRLKPHDRRLRLREQAPLARGILKYPSGWYFARFSEDLKRGQIVSVDFMSRRMALFRTKNGRVGLIDSQCCHMGADLGRCGMVDGESVACGYHGWKFGTDGTCDEVPGVSRIPINAGQTSYPTLEYGGNIWFWHGSEKPQPFTNIDYADSSRYLNIKGEVHIGQSGPLPIIEHIADISHFPHNHKAAGGLRYKTLADQGPDFEFQLEPAGDDAQRKNIQRLFKPHALITMASPCTGIYRTQRSAEPDRVHPLLTMILGVTPVRDDETIFTWRIAVRKIGPDLPLWPLNRLVGLIMWMIIRSNVHVDLAVLKWMRPVERPLWGSSGRQISSGFPSLLPAKHRHRSLITPFGWRSQRGNR